MKALLVAAACLAGTLGTAAPAQAHWCIYDVEDYPITACVTCDHTVEHSVLHRLVEDCDLPDQQ